MRTLWQHRAMESARNLGRVVLLCLVGGSADAIAYLRLGTFVGAMTGNTVLLGIDLAGRQTAEAGYHLCIIAAFLVAIIVTHAARLTELPATVPLVFAAIMLAASELVHDTWSALICAAALGIQNAAVTKIGGVSINTVFLTGDLLRLGYALSVPAAAKERITVALLTAAWMSYAVGALVGAIALHVTSYPMLVPAILMLIAAASELRNMSRQSG
jgi:uncharacterized membrane protein YoaK (UPF0700 family)